MDEAKKREAMRQINICYSAISNISVCGKDVENMAVARDALRQAWKLLKAEESNHEGGERENG